MIIIKNNITHAEQVFENMKVGETFLDKEDDVLIKLHDGMHDNAWYLEGGFFMTCYLKDNYTLVDIDVTVTCRVAK